MNKVYKVVFNKATGTFTAVSEYAKSGGKASSGQINSPHSSFKSLELKTVLKFIVLAVAMASGVAQAKFYVNGNTDGKCAVNNRDNANAETFSNVNSNNNYTVNCLSTDANTQTNRIIFWDDAQDTNVADTGTTNASFGGDVYLNHSLKVKNGATIDMGKNRIQNVATGTADTDAVNKAQLDLAISGANKQNYFHTNATATTQTGNTSNLADVDGIGGAKGGYATAGGINAQATKKQATAIGYRADALGLRTTALGTNSQAVADGSTALGDRAKAHTGESTAVGLRATAQGKQSTALGNDALAYGYASMSNGGNRSANNGIGLEYSQPVQRGLTANFTTAQNATSQRGTYAGSDFLSGQGFRRNLAGGENSQAWGTHAQALGNGSVAMGLSATAGEATATFGRERQDGLNSYALESGNHAISIGTLSYAQQDDGIAVGRDAYNIGKEATAIGSDTFVSRDGAVALGSDSVATRGALGVLSVANVTSDTISQTTTQNSNDGNLIETSAITDNKVYGYGNDDEGYLTAIANTVKGNAGSVSVGTIDKDGKLTASRQITNVAAGSLDSDAVNVAQLKAVAGASDRQTYFHANDNDVSNDSNTNATNYGSVDDTAGAKGTNSVAAGIDAQALTDSTVAIGNGASAGLVNPAPSKPNKVNSIAIGTNATATGGDAYALGANSVASGLNAAAIGTGSNATKTDAIAIGNKSFAVKQQAIAIGSDNTANGEYAIVIGSNAQTRAVESKGYAAVAIGSGGANKGASANGESSVAIGGGNKATTALNGAKTTISAINSVAIGAGSQASIKDAVALGSESVGDGAIPTVSGYDVLTNADSTVDDSTWRATRASVSVGDAANKITRQISDVAAGSADTDAVNVAQLKKVRELAGQPWQIAGNDASPVSDGVNPTEQVNFINGNATTSKVTWDTADKQFNVQYDVKVDGTTIESVQVDPRDSSKGTQLAANTTSLGDSDNNGKIDVPSISTSGNLVSAGDIANAINNSGFTVTSSANGGTNSGSSNELVNPGEKVEFVAGANVDIKQEAGKFTFSTNNQNITNNAQLPVVYTKPDGTKVYKVGANFYDNPAGTGTAYTGEVIASMNNGSDSTISPMALANVASTLPGTAGNAAASSTENAAPTFTATQKAHAATVDDVLNAGWNLQGNGKAVDFVKPYDTVNFKDGNVTTANVTSDGQTSEVSFDLKYDKDVFTENTDGELTLKESKLAVTNGNSTVNPQNGSTTTTGGGAGGNLTINAGKNLNASLTGTTVNISTVEKPSFTSVTLGDESDPAKSTTLSNAGDGLDVGGDKITNVADGEISASSTDAINGSQLYAVAGSSVTNTANIIRNSNNIADNSVKIIKNANNIASNTVAIDKNADDIANNTAGIKKGLNFSGDSGDDFNRQLGDTVNVEGGAKGDLSDGNIGVVSDGKDTLQVKLADDIALNSVTADAVNVNEGGDLTVGADANIDMGGNQVHNVAPGTEGTDAVNVNQLNDLGYQLNNRIDDVADDANAGVSSAMAMAALPQAYLPGKSMITGGMASYNGEGAVAVGLSKLSDNGRWVMKISGSADTKGNAGGSVGIGMHF